MKLEGRKTQMKDIDRTLTTEYAHLQETLIDRGLFEALEVDGEKLSTNLSHFQDLLAAKGVSQSAIDTATEAIWLAVRLGVRNRDAANRVDRAFAEILGALCDR